MQKIIAQKFVGVWIFGFICLAILLRLRYVQSAEVMLDEFQHLHAAFLVFHGQTPYVDFFEHHTPLFYYLGAAILPFTDPGFDTVIYSRYLSLAFSFLTLSVCILWVRSAFGITAALVTTVLLFSDFFIFSTGSLSYLDTYAVLFIVLSAWLLSISQHSFLRSALSGFCIGIAILFTQKALILGLAPAVYFILRLITRRRQATEIKQSLKELSAYAAGGLGSLALLAILLGPANLLAFYQLTLEINLKWKASHPPVVEIATLAANNGAVYLLTTIGSTLQLWSLIKRHWRLETWDVPLLYLAASALGVIILPVAFEEYFIQIVPFAAIIAAVFLVSWVDGHLIKANTWQQRVLIGAIIIAVGVDYLSHLLILPFAAPLLTSITMLLMWATLAILFHKTARRLTSNALLFSAALAVFPFVRQIDFLERSSNQFQKERVNYIMSHTTPSDTVFDGYRGYGVFRQHAYKYWFLHDEVQLMLSDEEKNLGIITALEMSKPEVVIVDHYILALPKPVLEYIQQNYVDTPFSDLRKRRKNPGAG